MAYTFQSYTDARAKAREHGMVFCYNREYQEYRVAMSKDDNASMYYTSDIDDAMGTLKMLIEIKLERTVK